MIESTITLLRQKGAAGTTIDAVLAHSGAPRGSVYHHFPGGRRDMLTAAVTEAGETISDLLRTATADTDSRSALDRFGELWRTALVSSDYQAGCPVVALVIDEGPDDPEIAEIASRVLDDWHTVLRDGLIANNIEPTRAERLATLVLSAVEGALVFCRSQHSTEPLEEVLTELAPILETR